MTDNTLEALHDRAEELWGEQYFIDIYEDADRDRTYTASHTTERVADGLVFREILRYEDGEFEVTTHLVDEREYLRPVGDANE